ncbi:MAG: hypothetical protein R6V40_04835 [Candidatus Moraniibacteriota bacterium]
MTKKKKKEKTYFITFTEEFWFNVKPEYADWAIGRVEIYNDNEPYAIDELRFATPRTKEWNDFREEWDFKDINNLEEFKELLKNFYQIGNES